MNVTAKATAANQSDQETLAGCITFGSSGREKWIRKQPRAQPEAERNVGIVEPAVRQKAKLTQTTVSTKNTSINTVKTTQWKKEDWRRRVSNSVIF